MNIDEIRPDAVIPLASALPGVRLRVVRIDAAGEDGVRLKRMGICEGRVIELLQSGDPLILSVVKCRVGLSRQLAYEILVCLQDTTACAADATAPLPAG